MNNSTTTQKTDRRTEKAGACFAWIEGTDKAGACFAWIKQGSASAMQRPTVSLTMENLETVVK